MDATCPVCTPPDPDDHDTAAVLWDRLTREHLDDVHPGIVRAVANAHANAPRRRTASTQPTTDGAGEEPWVPYAPIMRQLGWR